MSARKVYLIGAGPGSPGLITVKGLAILRQADVVIYDYLVNKGILDYVRADAQLVCCDNLRKSGPGEYFAQPQNRINNFMVKKVNAGKKVVRLKNGNPVVFSRAAQELKALVDHKIEFEIVPGVTAVGAASCLSGIPLTDRGFASNCVFVTGQEADAKKTSLLDWSSISKSGTIVLYMAVTNMAAIIKQLIAAGKDKNTPIAIVQDVSLPSQKILRGVLSNIVAQAKTEKVKPPAIIIIGEVVRLEKKFNWLMKNKRILFTGLSGERYFTKGTYFHLPLIKIEPMKNYQEFDNYLRHIQEFDWLVFASRYGVDYFFARLKHIRLDSRALSKIKIAVIGSSTKNRLLDFAISADLVPQEESSAGLIEKFRKLNLKDKKIFLPRSDISDKGLTRNLQALGAQVSTSFAYRNTIPSDLPELDLNFFHQIVFTSPSTVRNFKREYKHIPKQVRISCIGKVTTEEAKRCQLLG